MWTQARRERTNGRAQLRRLVALRLLANNRFHVQQALVHADLQYPGNGVFHLAGRITPGSTYPKLTNAHIAHGFGDDLVSKAVARVADDVLISIISRTNESALDMDRVGTATPRTRHTRAIRHFAAG